MGRPKKGKRAATHPAIAKDPDFPLSYNRSNKSFYKTHKGQRYYFGGDPVEAVKQYEHEWKYIKRGEDIPPADNITIGELFNLWLDERLKDANAGDIKMRTWLAYQERAGFVVSELGRSTAVSSLKPARFADLRRALDKRYGSSPTVFSHAVRVTKMAFKWADDFDIVDAPKMGGFKGASKKEVRKKRRSHGRQVYSAAEIRSMLDRARPTLKAAILVGLNGGFTQAEVAELRTSMIKGGIIDLLRDKTGVDRRVPLWPETIAALEAMPKTRPTAEAKGYLFVTRTGRTYTANKGDNGIGQAFTRLMKALDIDLKMAGFGKLRATFSTVADAVGDMKAKQTVMGHSTGEGVDEHYNRFNDDERLKAVTDHVRDWLYESKR
jgi:integrase